MHTASHAADTIRDLLIGRQDDPDALIDLDVGDTLVSNFDGSHAEFTLYLNSRAFKVQITREPQSTGVQHA